MKVNVFVLHYEKDEVTRKCVNTLKPQLRAEEDAHHIVIDNGSPVPFEDLWMEIYRLPKNLFLIDAFNEAMQEYPADVYFCISNDTVAHPFMLMNLLKELSDPSVGIVAPGTNDVGAGALYVPHPGNWESIDLPNVDNVCWGWRQDLVDKIGWPDCKGHTHRACWASNQDYAYRARKAGFRVVAVRSAYIEHAHTGGKDLDAWKAGMQWLVHKWGDNAPEVVG